MNTKAINLVFTLSKYYDISIKKEAIKNHIITLSTQLYSILIDHQLFLSILFLSDVTRHLDTLLYIILSKETLVQQIPLTSDLTITGGRSIVHYNFLITLQTICNVYTTIFISFIAI